jgi:hypothetical protein
LDITHGGNVLLNGQFFFQQNMMDVTTVELNAGGQVQGNRCRLTETNGFFFLALPLAYYTIQQFEFLNRELNYEWSPVHYNVRTMINNLKKNKVSLTGVMNVTMFKKNKSSLFQLICESVDCDDDVEPLAADFNLFLEKCCRWHETNENAVTGSSPKVIFRTLGIFNLQNAIDFACEMKANPNKTYLSLLASYPLGTQMVIQQCMKKLSSNEAYAWINQPAKVTPVVAVEKESDDDDDEDTTLAGRLLNIEDSIMKALFHSFWSVDITETVVPADNQAAAVREDEMAVKLLKQYKKSIVEWKFILSNDEAELVQSAEPGENLKQLLKGFIEGHYIHDDPETCELKVTGKLYDPRISYRVQATPKEGLYSNFVCSPICPSQLKFSTTTQNDVEEMRDGQQFKKTWDSSTITFTLINKTVTDGVVKDVKRMGSRALDAIRNILFYAPETGKDRLTKLLIELQEEEDERRKQAAETEDSENPLADLSDVDSEDDSEDLPRLGAS